MDAPFYLKILENLLTPFIQETFPQRYQFMQDHDPKHSSRLAKEYMEEQSVNWWKTAASSADINPIERVLAELKRYIARRVKPLSKSGLIGGIVLFWSRRMTQDKCMKYVRHANKVFQKVVVKEGDITGE